MTKDYASVTIGNIRGIIFDFDGVLVESEYVGNAHIAKLLTKLGYPTSTEDSLAAFSGLSGQQFVDAIEEWIAAPLPAAFQEARGIEDARVIAEGVDPVDGAIAFVRALPVNLPRAIASSSSTAWIAAHLAHVGLSDAFGTHIYSGREHVGRGKPAPDVYLYAANAIGVPTDRVLIIEDSVVGVTGAVASGAQVVGLAAGRHCFDGHADRLRAAGAPLVVHAFEDIAAMLGF